ncbi:glycosyltransferase [Chryseobacterium sp. JJR-5R]|uniref:glycosyltransferase n=1 Tax=Chryseobacterium sp. JJR-5R TaxID=3093923 RepID=UPI002A75A6FE|nr:glycosyltransferase [Chryseobacterium sp. JJR-5R]WPO83075.1 glycosyltransferase [Chryseobacterium sp. JJR-5R]
MLSIIISSYQPHYYDQLVKNINETIGNDFVYEIVQIQNPNIMGITRAYNEGALKAMYDYFLFLHEDVLFKTQDWGLKLISHLDHPDTGAIGIAGSSYVPSAPCGWYINNSSYNHIYCIQNSKKNAPSLISTFQSGETEKRAFALDGVFIATGKKNYKEILFNENLTGFHGYDLDFSLRMAKKFKNFVIGDILIEHFSEGNPDQKWFDNITEIRKNILPDFNQTADMNVEKKAFLEFMKKYFSYHLISTRTIRETLRFFPKRLNFRDKTEILKSYFYYIRYSKSYNKKFTNE